LDVEGIAEAGTAEVEPDLDPIVRFAAKVAAQGRGDVQSAVAIDVCQAHRRWCPLLGEDLRLRQPPSVDSDHDADRAAGVAPEAIVVLAVVRGQEVESAVTV